MNPQSNALHLSKLSRSFRHLRSVTETLLIEATIQGSARIGQQEAAKLLLGVERMNHLLSQALGIEVERLTALTAAEEEAAQPKPSMTKEAFVKSWREQPDTTGLAELKGMADEPTRLPQGVFVVKGGNPQEIQEQVTSMLEFFRHAAR